MRLEYQILLAMGLDLVVGDPRWLPHPVRLMGVTASALEPRLRQWIPLPRLAGLLTAGILIGLTAGLCAFLLMGAYRLHPLAGDGVGILLLYFTFAARDLALHSRRVHQALAADDLPLARQNVSMIVGRDTAALDSAGVTRAAVESVAENSVDGVIAPLFFACLAGPVGAMTYKAISTLDSLFGYKNERYLQFGWASARIDDLAAWIPARLTGVIAPVAAWILALKAGDSWRIMRRDSRRHASPNSGFGEAAFAGALGVQLGGPLMKKGVLIDLPTLGDPATPLMPRHILDANRLMLATYALSALLFLTCRWILLNTLPG